MYFNYEKSHTQVSCTIQNDTYSPDCLCANLQIKPPSPSLCIALFFLPMSNVGTSVALCVATDQGERQGSMDTRSRSLGSPSRCCYSVPGTSLHLLSGPRFLHL